ncbi:hypothetical protein RFI_34239 [Reticulomyxa filosa]|uniref:Uncharacterized protein n=1 Tax=Reticulomyxa filosa TaxID=46433 RepID=X6LP53_RETFI|nr:hypothetical protein RFI_34239 [Reticulomyxa filosa]|eukprot:ETO03171.1 hypothetical protein RFI_34239 [Reticulomyxa filosa]
MEQKIEKYSKKLKKCLFKIIEKKKKCKMQNKKEIKKMLKKENKKNKKEILSKRAKTCRVRIPTLSFKKSRSGGRRKKERGHGQKIIIVIKQPLHRDSRPIFAETPGRVKKEEDLFKEKKKKKQLQAFLKSSLAMVTRGISKNMFTVDETRHKSLMLCHSNN